MNNTLKIISASAGSGKTFTITGEYIKLLLSDRASYKDILAVTFTNKATEEMKLRIVKELYILSTNSSNSSYLSMLQNELGKDKQVLQDKARWLLTAILHDYSRFTVSTIDSFYMRVLKAFARELGLQTNFTTELDQNGVLADVSDILIANIEQNQMLQEWLQQFAYNRLSDGKSWDFKDEITKLGKQIFNEEYKGLDHKFIEQLSDKQYLTGYKEDLEEIQSNFEQQMKQLASAINESIAKEGLSTDDFLQGKSGVANYYNKVLKGDYLPTERVYQAVNGGKWVKKDSPLKATIESFANSYLQNATKQLVDYYENNYTIYNSACIILKNIYTLGILADLSKAILDYSAENNIFVLANTGELIKKLIEGNDAPFIYEKSGERFQHFIIDEFQDTSRVQWGNFKPLIANSLSEGNQTMLVGDIKQAIYRWRSGDWKIMAQTIDEDFQNYPLMRSTLDKNWRSRENIILFNNSIFELAPMLLQRQFNDKAQVSDNEGFISKAYANCIQQVPDKTSNKGGCVRLRFFDSKANKDWAEESKRLMVQDIEKLIDLGYRLRDIAILVRDKKEANDVSQYFLAYNNEQGRNRKIEFISNESVFVNQSPAVKIIISALKSLVQSDNQINKQLLASEYSIFIQNHSLSPLKQEENIILPEKFVDNADSLAKLPLLELIGQLIDVFELNKRPEFIPYIQAFVDSVLLFLNHNYSDIAKFVNWWTDNKHKITVTAPDQQDAVKIMTVHKSKGLEFENVFMPFCDWEIDHDMRKSNFIWVKPTQEPFNKAAFLPVQYSKELEKSIFEKDYFIEKEQAYIDNLNLLYVATTRAVSNLFVHASISPSDKEIKHTGTLLHQIVNQSFEQNQEYLVGLNKFFDASQNTFEMGFLAQAALKKEAKQQNVKIDKLNYAPVLGNVRQKFQSQDFFRENSDRSNKINHGILMHRIFQHIEKKGDEAKILKMLCLKGEISESEKASIEAQVSELLSSNPFSDWFSGKWQIKSEAEIIVPSTGSYRPDRVMVSDNKAVVLEYKFGEAEQAKYNKQVIRYMSLLEEMGYTEVEGYIYYFEHSKLLTVDRGQLTLSIS